MFSYEVRVPKERVAVVIGHNGESKRALEEATKTRIEVDSQEGLVTVSGEEAVLLYTAQQVIKAIGRGFNPDVAMRLLKQDWAFELIDLSDYSTHKNHQLRMKGRVIGQGGKARRIIEDLAEASVSVYGKTIAIIAPIETMGMAKNAVESLLEGAKHSTVYKALERKRRELRFARATGTNPERSG